MSRRELFRVAAAAPLMIAVPSIASAEAKLGEERGHILQVLEQLETWQNWEPSCTIAAKVFAASKMRIALGMPLANREMAQLHLDYQRQSYESYRLSLRYPRDAAAGKAGVISGFEASL